MSSWTGAIFTWHSNKCAKEKKKKYEALTSFHLKNDLSLSWQAPLKVDTLMSWRLLSITKNQKTGPKNRDLLTSGGPYRKPPIYP